MIRNPVIFTILLVNAGVLHAAGNGTLEAAEQAEQSAQSEAWYNKQAQGLPSAASQYGVGTRLLLAAGVSDANPQGTSRITLGAGAAKTAGLPNIDLNLKETVVKAKRYKSVGPMPGLNLTKEQIPGNIQSVTAAEIKQTQSLSITDLLNSKLQSVNVNDYQGNPFQMDLTYRGFTAGPQIGSQQGLSVFFDGIRVNEPFGDVVNWDMIPMNAISGLDVIPGSNPLYGLNTLGGAIAIKTKSGFDSPGVSAQILKGSYGRDQLQASAGWNNGTLAAFGAANIFMEDGWRDNSPSKVNQAFGKVEWQGEKLSLGFSTLAAVNKLVGNGTVPLELYKQDPSAVFTSPDETRNRLLQFQISGAFEVNDTFNITGMVYDRSSKRISSTGDIIDVDSFRDLGLASRRANAGENISCAFLDADGDGFPNYYLDEVAVNAQGQYTSAFIEDVRLHRQEINNGTYALNYSLLGQVNPAGIPDSYLQRAIDVIAASDRGASFDITDTRGQQQVLRTGLNGFFTEPVNIADAVLNPTEDNGYPYAYFTRRNLDGTYTRFNIIPAPAVNQNCYEVKKSGDGTKLLALDENGDRSIGQRDGALNGTTGVQGLGTGTGYVQGTPTAVITNSQIDQSGQGFGTQFNWNLDSHKFMIGLSLDTADAKYNASQRFGLIDNQRNVYSDPANIGEEYYAASHDVVVNAFGGTKNTKSVYFSETWTPTQTLNFSFSGRYNNTHVSNTLAPRGKFYNLTDYNLLNHFLDTVICPGTDLSACPYDPGKMVQVDEYDKLIGKQFTPLGSGITEKFSYYSFNPALGVTWQTTPRLNMYFNWNQGTRTPSVIELGCAYDDTPAIRRDSQGRPFGTGPASLVDGRACSLPSVMSGDPYLPQVRAQTYEVGVRGKFKDLLEWNVTGYRTALRDDLYLVAASSQLSFFQDVGATRRQGIEFGLQGSYGKHDFRVNYSLTEATFQSRFKTLSANNSNIISNDTRSYDYNQIQVEPGDRMPGVPLNNINLSWTYKMTPAFRVGLIMVAHGDSFVRGNENNEHSPGPSKGTIRSVIDENGNDVVVNVPGPDYRNSGKSPGYAVFNLRASYELGNGWTAGLLVNNLLDKEYFSAGRLGLTPFAPSINGAIGAGGFNYNSSEWLSTQFMSAGAPRGIWASLSYDFDASKKLAPLTSNAIMTEPDRTLEPAKKLPTDEELALAQTLDNTSAVPVLKRDLAQSASAIKVAEQQVNATINDWKTAWGSGNADAYLGHYSADFKPEGMSREVWQEQRKLQLISQAEGNVTINRLLIVPQGQGMTAVFTQTLGHAGNLKSARKVLDLEQQQGKWKIVREHELTTPVRENSAAIPARQPGNDGGMNIRIISLNKGAK